MTPHAPIFQKGMLHKNEGVNKQVKAKAMESRRQRRQQSGEGEWQADHKGCP